MKLYTKISIGLIAGAVVGVGVNFLSAQFDFDSGVSLVRAVEPIGIAWVRLIRMIVVPLVVASLVVGAASLGDLRTLGRVGGKTVGFYMFTTAVAVSIGLLLSNVMKPGRGLTEESRQALAAEYGAQAEGSIELANQAPSVVDMLLSMIPDNPVGAAANAQMLPLILFSILFGVAATMIREDRRKAVLGFFEGVNDISMQIIHWIMALAPYAVFALIASVTARFGFEILKSLMWYTLV
ncbi:MAG: dicarboxylate/amino acid:cation symporter, partial [Gemmatimonadota bacterium]|nr:dicarboxylate/amino acid:cation symporter [Gemmatimonadota bacterium]